jgi:putative transposase
MAQPRPVLPGITYLITRRCYQRTFRLRPHAETNRIFEYCLALAAEKMGVKIHGVVVMSNHHHLVVTDSHGVLPDFLRELHRATAKAINASQGQWENLWAAEQTSAVVLANDEDVIDKLAYLVANPVDAGLVPHPEQWPGVIHWESGFEKHVDRPGTYFGERSPEAATLRIVPAPREFLTAERWDRLLADAIDTKVRAARQAVQAAGASFIGPKGVMAQSFFEKARSYEIKRGINPHFAAKHGATRSVLARLWHRFTTHYRRALQAWRAGSRDVRFPIGTWWMRVQHGALVAREN